MDLEPLIVISPALFPLDPRLRDQVYGWCVAHRTRVSVSRLRGLLPALTPAARRSYSAFSASLREFDSIRWPSPEEPPWGARPDISPVRLPSSRPSLVRLRARWICGVGVRADVICELMGREPSPSRASELAADLGYTARQTRQVLSELQEAAVVRARQDGHGRVFRLNDPQTWRRLFAAEGVVFPRWSRITRLMLLALDLFEQRVKPPRVQRVMAHKHQDELNRIAERLGLESPPVTAGSPDAYEVLVAWVRNRLIRLADGTSPAFRRSG